MSPRGFSTVALVVLVAWAGGGRSVRADEPPPSVPAAAERFWKAVQRGDEAVQTAVATDPTIDPIDVAASLYTWYVSDHADPAKRGKLLAAMRALARHVGERRDAAGLAAVVEAHAALGDERLAADERRRQAWSAAKKLGDPVKTAQALAELAPGEGEAPTLITVPILSNAAGAWEAARKPLEAATAHAAAAQAAETFGWDRVSSESWELAARHLVGLSRWEPATRALEGSAAAFERLDAPVRLASVLVNLAVGRRRLGRFDASVEAATRAEAVARTAKDAPRVRAARLTRAETLLERGAWDEAEALLVELERETRAAGTAELGRVRITLALVHHRRGRLAEALTVYEEEAARLEAVTPGLELAVVHRNAGALLRELGLPERAHAEHRRALEVYEALGHRAGVAASLMNLGLATEALGRPEEGNDLIRRAVEAERAIGDPKATALALLNFAAFHRRTSRAAEGLALALEARRTLETAGLPVAAHVWNTIAMLRAAAGDERLALEDHLAAVRAGHRSGESDSTVARVFGDAASALETAGRSAEALPLARRCLDLRREALHGFEPAEASVLGSHVAQIAGLGVHVTLSLREQGTLDDARAAAEAFAFVEGGRALLLGQALATRESLAGAVLPDDLREEDRASRREVERARRTLDDALAGSDAAATDAARAGLSRAQARREGVGARIHRTAGRAAQVAWPRPIDLAGLQRVLRAGETLVLYQFSGSTLFALVVTTDRARLVDLGTAKDVENDVAAWLRLAAVPAGPEADLATRLHERLLRPLGVDLAANPTLVIVPDGPLCYLPFDALLDKAAGRRLVEHATVALVPSATTFASLREESGGRAPGKRVLALGDPAVAVTLPRRAAGLGFSVPARLPASADEARLVQASFPGAAGALLLGESATGDALRAALGAEGGPFRTVHLACHARVDPERPRLTGLLLAAGQVLDVDDVHRLRCDADLVVLSGCETARGALVTGEGLLGLTRGFFVAGARRVVASDWRVGDRATLDLMRAFYAGCVEGLAPAAALTRAKRALLARGGDAVHPSAWAAFVLWGLPE